MMNNNNQIKGNKLINTANNKDNKNIFYSIIYKNSNEINYEEYYIYNNKDNLYFCKLCTDFKGTAIKFVIERHLNEHHFCHKETCKICLKSFVRIKEHMKKHYNKNKIIGTFDNKKYFSKKNEEISFEVEKNYIFKKYLLKTTEKIIINNIFFYKNKMIGYGEFNKVFLGGISNDNEIMAVKILKSNYKYNNRNFNEEKNILVLIKNKGNFPEIYDWTYNEEFIFIIESLMGPTLKDLINVCGGTIDLISLYNISIDLINQVKILHESNILHGDIKPSNICYGNLSQKGKTFKRTIGFLDFGNSLIFKYKNKIRNLTYNNKNICTREYSSLDALRGYTYSRKDDIESILYVIIKIYTNKLPWNKLDNLLEYFTGLVNENKYINNNKNKKLYEKINILKTIQTKNKCNERLSIEEHIFLRENLSSEEICSGLPDEFLNIYKLVNNTKYKERPKYEEIINILENGKKKALTKFGSDYRCFELENGNIIQTKFKWEKIIYNLANKKWNQEDNESIEKMNEIIQNFCIDINQYCDYIFN